MKRIIIHHDFNLELKLYTLPYYFIQQVKEKFPKIIFRDIQDECNPENIEIFFGNRIKTFEIQKMNNLKWIHLGCVGYDSIDLNLLDSRKIILTNSKGIMADSIVEHAINFITTFSRGMYFINELRLQNDLSRKSFDKHFDQISNLTNQKILICGFGEVGKKLSKVLSLLGMDIFTISKTKKEEYSNFDLMSLKKIVPEMNYIVNLLPLNQDTENIFNKKIFDLMNNCYFLNLGRGKTVIEQDLIRALRNGNVKFAALDVFENEPLNNENELFKLHNVILTPHIAGLSTNYWEKQLSLFLTNLDSFFNKKTQSNKMLNLI